MSHVVKPSTHTSGIRELPQQMLVEGVPESLAMSSDEGRKTNATRNTCTFNASVVKSEVSSASQLNQWPDGFGELCWTLVYFNAGKGGTNSGSNKDCADTTLPFFIVATIPEVLLHVSFQPHIIVWGSWFTVLMDPLPTNVKRMLGAPHASSSGIWTQEFMADKFLNLTSWGTTHSGEALDMYKRCQAIN